MFIIYDICRKDNVMYYRLMETIKIRRTSQYSCVVPSPIKLSVTDLLLSSSIPRRGGLGFGKIWALSMVNGRNYQNLNRLKSKVGKPLTLKCCCRYSVFVIRDYNKQITGCPAAGGTRI